MLQSSCGKGDTLVVGHTRFAADAAQVCDTKARQAVLIKTNILE